MTNNTLFLRLAGPMQSWGTSSRFQLRRTDAYPSKSGVLGMLLCAKGVRREDSPQALETLTPLLMGARVDRRGDSDWDYHTAGAKIGIRSADGKIKKTASTGEYETLLSRRQYLYDASFLVALQGGADVISACADKLNDPVWPVFLGRKCCIPSEPVFAGMGEFDSLTAALSSIPWQARIEAVDRDDRKATRTLDVTIEHPAGSSPPDGARLVHDVPRVFGYYSHDARWVVRGQVNVAVGKPTHPVDANRRARRAPYGPEWDSMRKTRLLIDKYLCVFCKSPAVDVHHLDYEDVRPKTLRSLCKICHDACTMLEYGQDMQTLRIDPADKQQRPMILQQIKRLLTERRLGRRRQLLETGRKTSTDLFDEPPDSWTREGH
jgi:CRISPR system Cascade subunit CasD